jgi:hypothetical protein
VSSDLRLEIELELGELKKQVDQFTELRRKVLVSEPDEIEILAFAAYLHVFYSGMENIFKRIAVHFNETIPRGDSWHINLLRLMKNEGKERPVVISGSFYEILRDYLGFRHFFRNFYTYRLVWSRMKHLVKDSVNTFNQFEAELMNFLKKIETPE